LHLSIPEIADALVHVEDRAGRGRLAADEAEAAGDRALPEEALARADHDGEVPEPQHVDKIVPEQRLEEVAAAVDLDLAAFPRLEPGDLPGHVATEQGGVVPADLVERPRRDVLGPGVERRGDLVRRVGGPGPRGG